MTNFVPAVQILKFPSDHTNMYVSISRFALFIPYFSFGNRWHSVKGLTSVKVCVCVLKMYVSFCQTTVSHIKSNKTSIRLSPRQTEGEKLSDPHCKSCWILNILSNAQFSFPMQWIIRKKSWKILLRHS